MTSFKTSPLALVDIALDLQIIICTFLHPSDILALRKTCKAFQLPTRQRVVWVVALHRICLDNVLFLPSFPISDMSDMELEQAATAPRRWIELCAAFEKRHPNNTGAKLRPKTTRTIEYSLTATLTDHITTELLIVPGGRYLVSYSPNGISVWDLGYTSGAICKLIASVGPESESYSCMVNTTSDGMGLIIFSVVPCECCSIYEIYPQSETPQLTQIAHLDFDPSKDPPAHLLHDRVIWYCLYEDRIVFRVWDYRVNHSISFSADVDTEKFENSLEVIATKTAIFILCEKEVLVWAIPPLSPQPPDFFDHNPTHIPSLFGIKFPDGIIRQGEFVTWGITSCWYFGSSQPLYFDMLCRDSKLHRFEIIVKADFRDTSLHVINTSELTPYNFAKIHFQRYSICDDTLVSCWHNLDLSQFGAYTSSRFPGIISRGGPAAKVSFPTTGFGFQLLSTLCPASGRLVHLDKNDIGRITVVDFF